MCTYDFTENKDFSTFSKNLENGGRTIDHQLTIPMAIVLRIFSDKKAPYTLYKACSDVI
ncbi:MAG: antA/AntB antirepressor family protein [Ruminococcus sp.]|nr:antA/AntB antirepressor family protein [Ruminococcus sp.]